MHTVTIFEAEMNLAELLRLAQQGEDVVIMSGRKPVARLVAIDPAPERCRIGFLMGQGNVGPEFFEPLPEEELRLWNCEGQ